MTNSFKIHVDWEAGDTGSPEERCTHASLRIVAGGSVFTHVEDRFAKTTREVIRVSAYPAALWLASNWWRLTAEPDGPKADPLSHRLGAAGMGFLWPDLHIVTDGKNVLLSASSTRAPYDQPIAYLGSPQASIPSSTFTAGIEEFIERVSIRLVDSGLQDNDLARVWRLVREERRDPTTALFRRFEAILGFDPEEGATERIEPFVDASTRLGQEATMELAAGLKSVSDLQELESALMASRQTGRWQREDLLAHVTPAIDDSAPPWKRGEISAREARRAIGTPRGPITDYRLLDWLSLSKDLFKEENHDPPPCAVALRDDADGTTIRLLLRNARRLGRRFELSRLVCDHLLAGPEDKILPATMAKTARQQAQRAFAAEFLLPHEDLAERFRNIPWDEEFAEDTAKEFGVSPLMVQTCLVNKGLLDRHVYDALAQKI
ncbi:MAG: hypothetical protein KAI47_12330 [Deltaproteobacteria bacterium]|nr:hypothetical protein [Deltaproteobacteria bacterium]